MEEVHGEARRVHARPADRHDLQPSDRPGYRVRALAPCAVSELRTLPGRERTRCARTDRRGHLRDRRDGHDRPDAREQARRTGTRYHAPDPEGPAGRHDRCFPRSDGIEQPADVFDGSHSGLLPASHEQGIAARFYQRGRRSQLHGSITEQLEESAPPRSPTTANATSGRSVSGAFAYLEDEGSSFCEFLRNYNYSSCILSLHIFWIVRRGFWKYVSTVYFASSNVLGSSL